MSVLFLDIETAHSFGLGFLQKPVCSRACPCPYRALGTLPSLLSVVSLYACVCTQVGRNEGREMKVDAVMCSFIRGWSVISSLYPCPLKQGLGPGNPVLFLGLMSPFGFALDGAVLLWLQAPQPGGG